MVAMVTDRLTDEVAMVTDRLTDEVRRERPRAVTFGDDTVIYSESRGAGGGTSGGETCRAQD